MVLVKNRNLAFRLLHIKMIAVIQLIVMVMLALPGYCQEPVPETEKSSISQHFDCGDTGDDSCPCCPEGKGDDSDSCSTCGYCSYYAPLLYIPSFRYLPSVAELVLLEKFNKLSDVDIPIFVPPQNLV